MIGSGSTTVNMPLRHHHEGGGLGVSTKKPYEWDFLVEPLTSKAAVQAIHIFDAIEQNPTEAKYRTLNSDNSYIMEHVFRTKGAVKFYEAVGFVANAKAGYPQLVLQTVRHPTTNIWAPHVEYWQHVEGAKMALGRKQRKEAVKYIAQAKVIKLSTFFIFSTLIIHHPQACMERAEHGKAKKYLEHAIKVDPINPQTKVCMYLQL